MRIISKAMEKDKLYSGNFNGHDYVDLALPSSIKWATYNVGATKPYEYGDYFAWGEVRSKDRYDFETYKWCDGINFKPLTKYCTDKELGKIDNKPRLDLEDDAAFVNWGNGWRMPTVKEQLELINGCEWTKVDDFNNSGVSGFLGKSKYNGNYIFLPTAGYKVGMKLIHDDEGRYSSSEIVERCPISIYSIFQFSFIDLRGDGGRYYGQSVRAVLTKLSSFFRKGYVIQIPSYTRFVSIQGVEYRPYYYDDVVVDCFTSLKSYNLYNGQDVKDLFIQIKENPFIDGLHTCSGRLVHDFTFEFFLNELEKAYYHAKISRKSPNKFFWPFHRIRKSEVDLFYECSISLIIKGIEIFKFDDAGVGYDGYPLYYPEYIDISSSGKESEVVKLIPEGEIKKIQVGNPHDGVKTVPLIPKKYIEKIILRRKHLDVESVEDGKGTQASLDKEEVFTLDPYNPDEKIFNMLMNCDFLYKKTSMI